MLIYMITEQKTAEDDIDILVSEVMVMTLLEDRISVKELIQSFVKNKCREQREICAESAKAFSYHYEIVIDKSSILNAREPEI